jgi:hypothetical protein
MTQAEDIVTLQEVATEIVIELKKRLNVAGVVVLLVGKDDDPMGCAVNAPAIPFDTLVAATVQMLGALRTEMVQGDSRQEDRKEKRGADATSQ